MWTVTAAAAAQVVLVLAVVAEPARLCVLAPEVARGAVVLHALGAGCAPAALPFVDGLPADAAPQEVVCLCERCAVRDIMSLDVPVCACAVAVVRKFFSVDNEEGPLELLHTPTRLSSCVWRCQHIKMCVLVFFPTCALCFGCVRARQRTRLCATSMSWSRTARSQQDLAPHGVVGLAPGTG